MHTTPSGKRIGKSTVSLSLATCCSITTPTEAFGNETTELGSHTPSLLRASGNPP